MKAKFKCKAFEIGACTVPSRPRALTKGQSQHMVEPLQGPMEESQQVDRSSHRLAEASPKWGVDQERRRPRVASPKKGIAQERHRQARVPPG